MDGKQEKKKVIFTCLLKTQLRKCKILEYMLRCPECLLLTAFTCLLLPTSGRAEHQRPHHPSAQDAAAVCGEALPGRSLPHGCWNGTFYRIQKD